MYKFPIRHRSCNECKYVMCDGCAARSGDIRIINCPQGHPMKYGKGKLDYIEHKDGFTCSRCYNLR